MRLRFSGKTGGRVAYEHRRERARTDSKLAAEARRRSSGDSRRYRAITVNVDDVVGISGFFSGRDG